MNSSKFLIVSLALSVIIGVAVKNAQPTVAAPSTPLPAASKKKVVKKQKQAKPRNTAIKEQRAILVRQQRRVEGLDNQLRLAIRKMRKRRAAKLKAAGTQ